MSQVTMTITTPAVTVMCTGASTGNMIVTTFPTSIGIAVTSGQNDVVIPPQIILIE